MTARYTPGAWSAVVVEPAVVLLDPGTPADLVDAVWDALVAGGGVPAVIQAITGRYGADFAAIPPFAVAAPQRAGLAVAARGPVRVRVDALEGVTEVSGAEVTTWSERWVGGAQSVEVAPEADDDGGPGSPDLPTLPLRAGTALAASVWVPVAEGAPGPPVGESRSPSSGRRVTAPDLDAVPYPEGVAAEPSPAAGSVSEAVEEDIAGANETAVPTHAEATAPVAESTLAGPVEEDAVGDVPEPAAAAPRPRETPSLESTVTEAPEGSFDYLWGATRMTTVEDAAIREEEEDGDPSLGAAPAPQPRLEAAPQSAPARATAPLAGPRITAVPGMTDPFADDHDGETILSSELAAIRAQRAGGGVAAPVAAPVSGPSVLARVCPEGHANPPQAAQCRVCGTTLVADAVRVARPPLGRVRLSTGEMLDLDTPVVLGRSPRVGRVAGPDVPRPVVVPSPTREISGTHLAIRLEEWHVLVADLDSSNGTVLRRPGQPPQRLQPREQVLVRTGDVVDLGDGVALTFEDLP